MHDAFQAGWPFRHPPNMDFDLNWRSPQADGLVFWLPLGVSRSTGTKHLDRARGLVLTETNTPTWIVDGERGWSVLFDDAASEYLSVSKAVVTAAPLTLTCWFNSNDTTNNQVLLGIGAAGDNYFQLMAIAGGGSTELRVRSAAGQASAPTTSGYSANVWYHLAGVERASDDHACLINGGSKGVSVIDRTPVGLDRTMIGRHIPFGGIWYMSGMVSDARIYNRALSDAEVYAIYAPSTRWELYAPRVRFWPVDEGVCTTTVTVTETETVTVVAQQ